ncbi:DapH/DapD/GlmU-related protein [Riemerella anatipestifer]|uniref:acyltransferase n=1 Tax=Riemerella anatipestifer TaxID=34085 RepID=UPI002A849744|nr:DapH/DapD/GlmU-related protein [Riemerella anatipestifer]
MNIGKNAVISYKAKLDKSINPKGVHVGNNTWILAGATILAHDHCRSLKADTIIGNNCIIGINSIILPGIKVHDHSVVAAGAIVSKDVPSGCVVAGNPAKIIKENIRVTDKGKIL